MRKALIFLMLVLTVTTIAVCPNVGAATTHNILVGFWEGYTKSRNGFVTPVFIEFMTMENILGAHVELGGYNFHITDVNRNITVNDGKISIKLFDSNVYDGKLTNKRIVASAANGNILKLVRKKRLTTLKKIMKTFKPINQSIIVQIPASPKEGFYWSYFLALSSETYKTANSQFKQYLFVDTTNTGVTNNYTKCLRDTYISLYMNGQYSMQTAEKLGLPILLPAFPRPNTFYRDKNENRYLNLHSFTRDMATLSLILKDQQMGQVLREHYGKIGFDINTLAGLDLQLIAMIKHATQYLAKKGYRLESKVFMCGFSASGTFVDRFTVLHPEWVKAVVSGATLDNMVLPLAEYKGEKLIFPIGVYDYQAITGNPFDLEKHNSVARLNYMGEKDSNNTVSSNECHSRQEQAIITKLWGIEVLPRAKSLIEVYGLSGGKGVFILDRGIGHKASQQMKNYIKEFFQANRNSDGPVYPIPKDDQQLSFTLFQ